MNANNFLLGVSSVKKNNSKKELNKNKNRLNIEKITVEEKNNSNGIIRSFVDPDSSGSAYKKAILGPAEKNGNILFSNKINSLNIEKNNSLLVQQNLNKTNEVFPKYSVELINHIKNIENDIKNNHVVNNVLLNNIKMKNVISKIISKLEGNINSLTNKINKFNYEKKELQNISKKEQENFKNIIRKMYILIITIYKSLIVNKEDKIILLEKLRNTIQSNTQFLNNIDRIVKENNKEIIVNNNLVQENNITISNILQKKNINLNVERKNNTDIKNNTKNNIKNNVESYRENNLEKKTLNKNYLNLLEENKKNIETPTSSVIRKEKKEYEKVANKIANTKINEATAKNKLNKYISYLQ